MDAEEPVFNDDFELDPAQVKALAALSNVKLACHDEMVAAGVDADVVLKSFLVLYLSPVYDFWLHAKTFVGRRIEKRFPVHRLFARYIFAALSAALPAITVISPTERGKVAGL